MKTVRIAILTILLSLGSAVTPVEAASPCSSLAATYLLHKQLALQAATDHRIEDMYNHMRVMLAALEAYSSAGCPGFPGW